MQNEGSNKDKQNLNPIANEPDATSNETQANQNVQQPQTVPNIQLQIPQNLQQASFQIPLLPNIQPPQQPPRILANVQALIDTVRESTKEGNNSEAQVPSQIILISSAVLTIIGVFALSSDEKKFSVLVGVLLLIAVCGLGVSLLAGVFHFASERKFWYGIRAKGIAHMNIISAITNPADQDNAASQALTQLDGGSNRIAFWIQIIAFTVGTTALILLVIGKIIARIN